MRIRTIKPEFWSSAKTARVPREVRLVFIGLWNQADDDGRLLASPKRLAGSLFEHDKDATEEAMDGWLTQLERAQLIIRYEVKGTAYVAIPGFGEHQRIDKRWASRLPAPPENLAQHRASLAGERASLPQLCAPDMSSSGNVFLSEMTPFGEGNTAPPKTPSPAPVVATVEPEPEDEPQLTTLQRMERRESEHVTRSATRTGVAFRAAAASAVFGRPQGVSALLALRVVQDDDGRLTMAPESVTGTALREVWTGRYKSLDGKGDPRRDSIAEVLERVWDHSVAKPWKVDGTGVGASYLAWWSGILAAEASKVRIAWERDGGTGGGDPERGAAKRKYHELQGLGRDLPPFDTWFADFKRGATETMTPSSPPGSGSRPSGPRSGAVPVHAADVMRATHDAMAGLSADAGAAGLAAMKAKTTRPRAPLADDADLGPGVQS